MYLIFRVIQRHYIDSADFSVFMYLQWFGQSFFKITTKNSLGQELTLAIDPFNKNYGLKTPNKFGADIDLITHDQEDHNNLEIIKGT